MYKFAVLPYMNASPLVHFLPQVCPGVKLIRRLPRNSVSELLCGNVDAAIVPVVDYFNTPGLEMVQELGICANGNVESVLLQCNKRLQEVRTVRFDSDSKTSNLLLKVLAKEHLSLGSNTIWAETIKNPDASVIIGDRALCAASSFETYDLAGEWKQMTGLPFVFAVWVYRAGHPDALKLTQIFHAAKQAGYNAIDMLSKIYTQKLDITEERCYYYLTNCIHYDIGADERAGMELFRKLMRNLQKYSHKSIQAINSNNVKGVTYVKA